MKSVYKMTTTKRAGKVALWIGDWNVWDLDKQEVTSGVLSAIANAYNMGRRNALHEVRAIDEETLSVSDPLGKRKHPQF
jgi:hypothetical protein